MVLKWLPVTQNSALEGQAAEAGESPIKSVLRSKGFMWMSYSHASAFYWSHAGQHFDIRDEGDWYVSALSADPLCRKFPTSASESKMEQILPLW